MVYVITEPCIGNKDKSCIAVCPVSCIKEAANQFYIAPDECINCGVCEDCLPVRRYFADIDIPEKWTQYIEKNRAFADGSKLNQP